MALNFSAIIYDEMVSFTPLTHCVQEMHHSKMDTSKPEWPKIVWLIIFPAL